MSPASLQQLGTSAAEALFLNVVDSPLVGDPRFEAEAHEWIRDFVRGLRVLIRRQYPDGTLDEQAIVDVAVEAFTARIRELSSLVHLAPGGQA